ncbi:hypothetical protein [Streptomyces sp. ISL-94]|uniref:hypothetical protein n=1 Tax=Streptomyces sp. ISL-94 TaxID=2819190 RepID=UPI001BE6DDED|nr:hypothetical protein [Streptomyces sp. ISL-94]MBT2480664.1 hypothetical protein [Streptomyces sp. ISL-94]
MPRPSPDRPARRTLPAIAVCAAALLSGGCAGHPAPRTPSASIEEIAAAIGCTAEVSVQADELRQGGCQTGQGAFRMVTFAAAEGRRSWLAEARTYGGSYLVGDRWVVTAQPPEALDTLRLRLGGSLDSSTEHAGHTGHTGHAGHPL